jgi:predicted nucleic acid-binding protein
MKYWDSSAIVPLCLEEATSRRITGVYQADPVIITWWGSEIECVSAFARLERDGTLDSGAMTGVLERLRRLRAHWHEVQPAKSVRDVAMRLLRVHPLRAADALQLSSAVVASNHDPVTFEFVTLDGRMSMAAQREGFSVPVFE